MDKARAVAQDMRESMARVERAEPVIRKLLKNSRIKAVEGQDNDVLQMLDLTCGIDYYAVYDKTGLVRGVGSRFQVLGPGARAWNTFTVRKARESGAETEYEKRKRAIEKGGEYPYLTMQAYVDQDERLVSLGIAKTADVLECIDRGLSYEQHTRRDKIGQASFNVVRWDVMRKHGYQVLIYEDEA